MAITTGIASWYGYHTEKEVVSLQLKLKDVNSQYSTCQGDIIKQNQAIDNLKKAADSWQEAASKAVEQAKKDASKTKAKATSVLSRQPKGTNDYDNAADLLNEAIDSVTSK
ncbi:MAG TPA: hypothetical protein VFM18_12990 [Methanosarcina sp.]|nr:hypothetical protein [Methanosarcina sp.]